MPPAARAAALRCFGLADLTPRQLRFARAILAWAEDARSARVTARPRDLAAHARCSLRHAERLWPALVAFALGRDLGAEGRSGERGGTPGWLEFDRARAVRAFEVLG